MTDLKNINDIELIVRSFYEKAFEDDLIGFMFTDVAELDLESHVPSISKFWENAIFHTGGYKKNVTQIHLNLNEKQSLSSEQFERWLELFNATVDAHFEGENAEKMKKVANNVALMLKVKLGML